MVPESRVLQQLTGHYSQLLPTRQSPAWCGVRSGGGFTRLLQIPNPFWEQSQCDPVPLGGCLQRERAAVLCGYCGVDKALWDQKKSHNSWRWEMNWQASISSAASWHAKCSFPSFHAVRFLLQQCQCWANPCNTYNNSPARPTGQPQRDISPPNSFLARNSLPFKRPDREEGLAECLPSSFAPVCSALHPLDSRAMFRGTRG